MELEELRARIDQVDDGIVGLFRERMEIAREIAQVKERSNLPILNKGREREVLVKVSREAGEGMESYARMLFSILFEMSRSYQARLTVKQGEFTQKLMAARLPAEAAFPTSGVVACQGVEGARTRRWRATSFSRRPTSCTSIAGRPCSRRCRAGCASLGCCPSKTAPRAL